ncbi:MAG: hypothetical protein NC337_09355 [Roseburia sp.]|nr:hypothetical protein [Roseburia sp.]
MANIDFAFDFESALSKAYHDDAIYQKISDIAKGLDSKKLCTEKAIRQLIDVNSTVIAEVLTRYNYELLNEI